MYEQNADGTRTLLPQLCNEDGVYIKGSTTVNLALIKGMTYTITFWAANENAPYDFNGQTVTIDYSEVTANNENLDAFYGTKEFNPSVDTDTNVELRRPFAQLNAIATDFGLVKQSGINVLTRSEVTVQGYNTLNLLNGEVSGDLQDITFRVAAIPEGTVTDTNAHLAMNYVLVNAKELVNATFKFYGKHNAEETDEMKLAENTYTNIPLQRNYKTNIIGSLLSKSTDFEVEILPGFGGDHNSSVIVPEDGKLETLITNEVYAQETAQIILESDVTWTTGAGIGSTPLIPEGAALMDLVIEGGVASRAEEQPVITFVGNGVGAVRAANGGTITFRNVKIVDQSVSYAENNWEYGYLEFGGNLKFENCTFVNAIMVEGEGANASFTDCYFNSNKENEYALWVSAGNVSVKDSTIEGWRGFKTHEAYGSEVASFAIDKCDFTLTNKPGLAIGTVNAETAISIKNSTFNTAAGDQGLYFYETDTDVTTFNFTLENNKIAVDNYASLAQAVAIEGANIIVKAGSYSKEAGVGLAASWAKNVTVTCEEGVKFEGLSKLNINGSTLIGGEFVNPNGNVAVDQTINGTFKNCNFNDTEALRWCYAGETVVFEECIFGNATCVRGVHFDGGQNEIVFNKCTLYGFQAIAGEVTKITFNECNFAENSNYNVVNMYSVFEYNDCKFNPAMHCDCASNGVVAEFNRCVYTDGSDIKSLVRFDYDQSTCVVRFDGKLLAGCKPPYTYDDSTKTYSVGTAEALVAISEVKINGDEKIVLTADIDLAGVEFNGISAFNSENNNTFDGQNHTISNWTNNSKSSDMGFIRSWVGTIKNVNFDNCHLKTSGRSAIVAGNTYANIENVHLTNCSVEDSYWACGLIAGLYNSGDISNCTVRDSSVKSNGGTGGIVGVINESTGIRVLTNCSVKGTTVNNTGAYGEGYSGALLCGMINISNSTVKFVGCTYENNTKVGKYVGDLYYAVGDDINIIVE